jgi:hypothetical protein
LRALDESTKPRGYWRRVDEDGGEWLCESVVDEDGQRIVVKQTEVTGAVPSASERSSPVPVGIRPTAPAHREYVPSRLKSVSSGVLGPLRYGVLTAA